MEYGVLQYIVLFYKDELGLARLRQGLQGSPTMLAQCGQAKVDSLFSSLFGRHAGKGGHGDENDNRGGAHQCYSRKHFNE